ncbi:hypothetical protein [Burkholderia sp. S-53]|uniref:hypothetical protein n=1 Tax=Burkholderia sp. S-53 TaxID=2906514 RepID=UPI0021CE30BC|nr:hypothetical protein [Burkholderia sp. S-53]UXU92425.1 hypothetical protein LXM88_32855 [Burkholderia sp. S-53]
MNADASRAFGFGFDRDAPPGASTFFRLFLPFASVHLHPTRASLHPATLADFRAIAAGRAPRVAGTAAALAQIAGALKGVLFPRRLGPPARPILRRLGLEATVRPSLAFYNTCDEVDALVRVVQRLAARR